MAKKNLPAEAVKPGTKAVRLELSPEHQARLRVMAAEAGLSMAAFARAIVVRVIQESPGPRTNA